MTAKTTPTASSIPSSPPPHGRRRPSKLPVVLYIPNILGYLRILLALIGLHYSKTRPGFAIWTWITSATLDFFDGYLARKLHQTSVLGIYIDIAADNVLRGSCWMATANVCHDNKLILSYCMISLEWITMLCTQLYTIQQQQKVHWKETIKNDSHNGQDQDPWWIECVFRNNFKNPMGCLVIWSTFCASMFSYGTCIHHSILVDRIPLYYVWAYVCWFGRVLGVMVELYLCHRFLKTTLTTKSE